MNATLKPGLPALALGALLLAGCASSGMGGGDIVRAGQPPQPVLFAWQSRDGAISGTLTATLPDATYQGRFMEITHSGKVIANLNDPSGRQMRCRLQLQQPDRGLAGGGDGECQVAGSPSFHASF